MLRREVNACCWLNMNVPARVGSDTGISGNVGISWQKLTMHKVTFVTRMKGFEEVVLVEQNRMPCSRPFCLHQRARNRRSFTGAAVSDAGGLSTLATAVLRIVHFNITCLPGSSIIFTASCSLCFKAPMFFT